MAQHYKIWTKYSKIFCIQGNLTVGSLIETTIRTKITYGLVFEKCCIDHEFSLNSGILINLLPEEYIRFIQNIAIHLYIQPHHILRSLFNLISKRTFKLPSKNVGKKSLILSLDQQKIHDLYNWKDMNLLWGVTGSGKTEVSISLMQEQLKVGKQILILVPEIALAHNMIRRCKQYLSASITTWHSRVKTKSKFKHIIDGNFDIVVGARSSIFLPFKNLGMIIMDEEHDESYKQESAPYYHARTLAALRCKDNISGLLMSATPSITSLYKNFNLLRLNKSFNTNNVHVSIEHIGSHKIFTKNMLDKICTTLSNRQQVVILCNKRGFSNAIVCNVCKKKQYCNICETSLMLYKDANMRSILKCNKCNGKFSILKCVFCGANSKSIYGYGVDKLSDILKYQFPDNVVEVVSSDYYKNARSMSSLITRIQAYEIQILIGTKMLFKGHDFKHLGLAIIFPDNLHGYSFNMMERFSQNLVQISGRVGRHEHDASIIIATKSYTNNNFHTSLNYEKMVHQEIQLRRLSMLPPFSKFYTLHIKCKDNITHVWNIIKPHTTYIQLFCNINKYRIVFKPLDSFNPIALDIISYGHIDIEPLVI